MKTKPQLIHQLSILITQGEELMQNYIELQQETLLNLTLSESTRVKIQLILDELKNTPDEYEIATQD